ncbi:MAG: hypothetical protein QM770_20040 [Tepidisphaeraceae bacterium]
MRSRLVAILVLTFTAFVAAQTTQPALAVRAGFSGVARPGTWTPVFVNVTTDSDASAELRLMNPLPRRAMADVTTTPVSLAPGTTTYTVYARAGDASDWPLHVSLLERDTDKRLADVDPEQPLKPLITGAFGRLVGVSGNSGVAGNVVTQLSRLPDTAAGALATRLLPDVSVGYDCIDTLVLASLDANTLPADTQLAIVDWVRQGGSLVVWLDVGPLDKGLPLIDALPASIGIVQADSLGRASRVLTAKQSTARVNLGSLDGIAGRVGLGHVVVLSTDPTSEPIVNAASVAERWNTLINTARPRDGAARGQLESAMAADLKLVPASGGFDWHTALLVAVGALVLIGPVESVLAWTIARRPVRAWWSVSAWALLAPAIVGLGMVEVDIKGEASRTVSVTDEVGGRALERTRVIGFTSPRPIDVAPATSDTAWWSAARFEPVPQPEAAELVLRQSSNSQQIAGALRLGRSNTRWLTVNEPIDEPAVIDAQIDDTGVVHVSNAGTRSISRVRIVRGNRTWDVAKVVKPNETIDVDPRTSEGTPLPKRRDAVGYEQRMNVASRDADDTWQALSRHAPIGATVVLAELEAVAPTTQPMNDAKSTDIVRAIVFEKVRNGE